MTVAKCDVSLKFIAVFALRIQSSPDGQFQRDLSELQTYSAASTLANRRSWKKRLCFNAVKAGILSG
jgi:hypothetical protein